MDLSHNSEANLQNHLKAVGNESLSGPSKIPPRFREKNEDRKIDNLFIPVDKLVCSISLKHFIATSQSHRQQGLIHTTV